ncbi:MAG: hypothetical protein JKY95_18150 [Planctomycetaceae bacterium]|nr:hypothetical protein [Planctomycetaceae bacterium]
MVAVQETHEENYRHQVVVFLGDLNRVQKSLLELQKHKRDVLVARNFDEANEVQLQEENLHQQLQTLLSRRQDLLVQMRSKGFAGQTLKEVCSHLGWDREPETDLLLKQARQLSDSLRQTSWGTWVFTHRASQYYGSILELIAQGGKKSSIYHDGSSMHQEPSGGSLLDASI